jgi:hypothetical protein
MAWDIPVSLPRTYLQQLAVVTLAARLSNSKQVLTVNQTHRPSLASQQQRTHEYAHSAMAQYLGA